MCSSVELLLTPLSLQCDQPSLYFFSIFFVACVAGACVVFERAFAPKTTQAPVSRRFLCPKDNRNRINLEIEPKKTQRTRFFPFSVKTASKFVHQVSLA